MMNLFVEQEHPRIGNGTFTDKTQSPPEMNGMVMDSLIPTEPTSWKDGDVSYKSGANYDGWITSDDVAERTEMIVNEAIESGELDGSITYSVASENSGDYGTQSVVVTAAIPPERVHEFADGQQITQAGDDLRSKLERIASSWDYSRSEPWMPPQSMYTANVRLIEQKEQAAAA